MDVALPESQGRAAFVCYLYGANDAAAKGAYVNAKFKVEPAVRDLVTGIPTSKAARPIPYQAVGPGFDMGAQLDRIYLGEPVEKVLSEMAKQIDTIIG